MRWLNLSLLAGVWGLFWLTPAFAHTFNLPPKLIQEVISESVPFSFRPNPLSTEDFQLHWRNSAPSSVSAFLRKGSLEWVRVQDLLVFPRAQVEISFNSIRSGKISYADFSQVIPVDPQTRTAKARFPVALVSGAGNPIKIEFTDADGNRREAELLLELTPRTAVSPQITFDVSCSKYGLEAHSLNLQLDTWAYVGCRLVRVEDEQGKRSSLELFMYWDNVGQEIAIDGVKSAPASYSVWPLRVESKPGRVQLASSKGSWEVVYKLPEKLHSAFIGVGIGPYAYRDTRGRTDEEDTIVPLVTFYGSYFLTETTRIVIFDATAIHWAYFSDVGLYLWLEQIRLFDQRFSVNLLLGAHALIFENRERFYVIPSVPQGVEFQFRDAFLTRYDFTLGAFIHPHIQGRTYYNAWLRWGSPAVFAELNFILWEEKIGDDRLFSRSAGVSLGFPLVSFF